MRPPTARRWPQHTASPSASLSSGGVPGDDSATSWRKSTPGVGHSTRLVNVRPSRAALALPASPRASGRLMFVRTQDRWLHDASRWSWWRPRESPRSRKGNTTRHVTQDRSLSIGRESSPNSDLGGHRPRTQTAFLVNIRTRSGTNAHQELPPGRIPRDPARTGLAANTPPTRPPPGFQSSSRPQLAPNACRCAARAAADGVITHIESFPTALRSEREAGARRSRLRRRGHHRLRELPRTQPAPNEEPAHPDGRSGPGTTLRTCPRSRRRRRRRRRCASASVTGSARRPRS